MKTVDVKVVNEGKQQLPQYATPQSAGMDLRANIEEPFLLHPGERHLFPTGLHIQLPDGYEGQIRPRSGLALKYGISMVNCVGTLDADYTGDVGVLLINLSNQCFQVSPGDRIAQLVISPIVQGNWVEVKKLDETKRGNGGYGHSGTK